MENSPSYVNGASNCFYLTVRKRVIRTERTTSYVNGPEVVSTEMEREKVRIPAEVGPLMPFEVGQRLT